MPNLHTAHLVVHIVASGLLLLLVLAVVGRLREMRAELQKINQSTSQRLLQQQETLTQHQQTMIMLHDRMADLLEPASYDAEDEDEEGADEQGMYEPSLAPKVAFESSSQGEEEDMDALLEKNVPPQGPEA
jgi:hypothetical protein